MLSTPFTPITMANCISGLGNLWALGGHRGVTRRNYFGALFVKHLIVEVNDLDYGRGKERVMLCGRCLLLQSDNATSFINRLWHTTIVHVNFLDSRLFELIFSYILYFYYIIIHPNFQPIIEHNGLHFLLPMLSFNPYY